MRSTWHPVGVKTLLLEAGTSLLDAEMSYISCLEWKKEGATCQTQEWKDDDTRPGNKQGVLARRERVKQPVVEGHLLSGRGNCERVYNNFWRPWGCCGGPSRKARERKNPMPLSHNRSNMEGDEKVSFSHGIRGERGGKTARATTHNREG